MKIECVFVGKTSTSYLDEGIADFSKRLGRYTELTIKYVKDSKSKASISEVKKLEGKGILKSLAKSSYNVVLDPNGKQLSSEALARQISNWQQQNRKLLTFIVGGDNGFSEEIYKNADFQLSLSKMTFTHEMVRVVLLEQIYRAYSILAGTKYHK